MKSLLHHLLLLPTLLLGLTACDMLSSGSDSGPSGPIRVLAMGDSNTGQVIYPGVLPWPNRLPDLEPSWSVVNSGRGGANSEDGRQRIASELDRHQPDVVVIMYGVNNATRGHTASFKPDIRAMIQAAKARDVRVVLADIMPLFGHREIFNPTVDRLNQDLEDLSREEKVRLVRLSREFRGETAAERFPDGLHPDADGMRIITVAIREGIRKTY